MGASSVGSMVRRRQAPFSAGFPATPMSVRPTRVDGLTASKPSGLVHEDAPRIRNLT